MSDVELEEADHRADRPSGGNGSVVEPGTELAGDSASVEPAHVEVLSAEVRVLQVGSRQMTRSMYRQLEEAIPEQFQALGRVRDKKRIPKEYGISKVGVLQLVGRDTKTRALVRRNAEPTDWSPREGPSEFAHYLLHTRQGRKSGPYLVGSPDGRRVLWTVKSNADCPGPSGWHASKDKPDLPVVGMMGEGSWDSEELEENKEPRIRQLLQRIVLAFSYTPPPEANEETQIEQAYAQWLEENRTKRCTVELKKLKQAFLSKADAELAELLEAQARYDGFKALPLIIFTD
jgi:hypothetical protein